MLNDISKSESKKVFGKPSYKGIYFLQKIVFVNEQEDFIDKKQEKI